MKIDWKDVLVRSLKTFGETAFSCLIASLSGFNFGQDNAEKVLLSLGLSACAAGVAAVWNGIIVPILKLPPQVPPDMENVEAEQ